MEKEGSSKNWGKISFLKRSKHRQVILGLLVSPKTPSQLKEILNSLHFNAISRTLNELEKENLINCMNPNQKQGRFYKITSIGEKTLKNLSEINNS